MRNNVFAIAKKEFARFFSNRASAILSIVLPGAMIFVMWTFMGSTLQGMFEDEENTQAIIVVVNEPDNVAHIVPSEFFVVKSAEAVPHVETMREAIAGGTVDAYVVFPEDFEEVVATHDPSSGKRAPHVEIFYNSSNTKSLMTYGTLDSALEGYESLLANRFDVNAQAGLYDLALEEEITGSFVVMLAPLFLLLFTFTSCMSLAAESVAGEKERGTIATLLATPVKRQDIALGKIIAIATIGLMTAISSMVGVFTALPNLLGGEIDVNVYSVTDLALLVPVMSVTALLIVMTVLIVSTLAKTVKEATMFLTPLMIVVMLVGLGGMFGNVAPNDWWVYIIPLYNSVQCMVGIFGFDPHPTYIALCTISNILYIGIGVFILQRMFDSEKIMFNR